VSVEENMARSRDLVAVGGMFFNTFPFHGPALFCSRIFGLTSRHISGLG
jgi:hypothetical protein